MGRKDWAYSVILSNWASPYETQQGRSDCFHFGGILLPSIELRATCCRREFPFFEIIFLNKRKKFFSVELRRISRALKYYSCQGRWQDLTEIEKYEMEHGRCVSECLWLWKFILSTWSDHLE